MNPLRAGLGLVLVASALCGDASAQELEPGAYWPIPAGLNIITLATSINKGDVNFDPTLPVDESDATLSTTAIAFTRAFDLAGRSAQVGVAVPVVGGKLTGLYLGEYTELTRFGLADPRIRVAMNLYGAPAMSPAQFASYRQKLLVGVSLTVMPPLGQYVDAQRINVGNNRWSFKPEVGVSRAYGRWVLEAMAGVWLFTDNDSFAVTRTRSQQAIGVVQVHLTHRFGGGMWLAGDANFYTGGRTSIDGTENFDLQRNSRVGATFSKALNRRHAIRVSFSTGAYTTIGADFTSLGVAYNYAWAR